MEGDIIRAVRSLTVSHGDSAQTMTLRWTGGRQGP